MRGSNIFFSIFYIILRPLSSLWESVYKIRRFLYDFDFFEQKEFEVPIISIGNLTFGGTGKTPFTLWVSRHLEEKNKKVMILTRGHKGNLEKASGIIKSEKRLGQSPVDFGDEPVLLAKGLKNACVVVGKNRSENLDYYFEKESPDVVLLDDGHQHIKLRRNKNIVLFDCLLPLRRYRVAPLGYMREGFSALKDADLIILGRSDQVDEKTRKKLRNKIEKFLRPNIPFAEIFYHPIALHDLRGEKTLDLDILKGKRVVAAAGVASPQSFFNLLESLGADLVERFIFPDHHYFSADEVRQFVKKSESLDAIVITTEKDSVKLKRVVESDRVFFLEISVDFLSGKEHVTNLIDECCL